MKNLKIAFFPGAFNPVHKVHLDIAKRAKEQYGFDKIVFLVRNNHLHKANKELPMLEDTFNMVNLAIEPYKYMDCLALDFKGNQPIDLPEVNKILKKIHGQKYTNIIMGDESFLQTHHWKNPGEAYKNMRFYINPRYHHINIIQKNKFLEKRNSLLNNIKRYLDELTMELSSSRIRHKDVSEEKLDHYVPESVSKYFKLRNLYKEQDNGNLLNFLKTDTYTTPNDNASIPVLRDHKKMKQILDKSPKLNRILLKRDALPKAIEH